VNSDNENNKPQWLIFRLLYGLEDAVMVLMLVAMIVVATGQIILRNFFDTGIIWLDPMLRVMVLWIGLLGAMAATRVDKHIRIDVLTRLLPPKLKIISHSLTLAFAGAVSGIIAWHSYLFVISEMEYGSNAFAGIPAWVLESIIPFSFAVMTLRFCLQALFNLGKLNRAISA
jgi:TRAP-type C4-dicarboxylate transport system permease small subunit